MKFEIEPEDLFDARTRREIQQKFSSEISELSANGDAVCVCCDGRTLFVVEPDAHVLSNSA